MIKARLKGIIGFFLFLFILSGCSTDPMVGTWNYEVRRESELSGTMEIASGNPYNVKLNSEELGEITLQDVAFENGLLTGTFQAWDEQFTLNFNLEGESINGTIGFGDEERFDVFGFKHSDKPVAIDRSGISYLLPESSLDAVEKNIDHAGIIGELDGESYRRGSRIYNANCINCHGNEEIEGSLPNAAKFWEGPLKAGNDHYSLYLTITRGMGAMPPQVNMTPIEKYDVINYIRKRYLIANEVIDDYVPATSGYLAGLPKGTTKGPEPTPYHPWSDMDYGNFFINTYELVDEETGPERYHSPGPTPFADENYLENNFAYKGIAVRLDEGEGGVSDGNTWMIFDHDVMRVAGGWTGDGFIDWNAILLNDRHETYPRTIGKLHFETPVGPGWANPVNGSFEDPRFTARDGRKFGPLPKKWANYKGIYHQGDNIIISYSVGRSDILERLGMEDSGDQTIFTRTLNISPSGSILRLRIAPAGTKVALSGKGATLTEADGFVMMDVAKNSAARVKLFIGNPETSGLEQLANTAAGPENLKPFTTGGPAHYPEELTSVITRGRDDGMFAIDQLTPPFDNPWDARMKLSGIDFMADKNVGVVCTVDGDVFRITGLLDKSGILKWQRIAAGMFQPLGIKVLDEKIYVICRDQLVRLQDFNGDYETDFYESFNHDHQVTDHFHEFAMGLQSDPQGNLYYAKSGRHAREALIPQHGTLLKVSKDGSSTEILATGFRAANGILRNSDGSFVVTDQQGYWNPMNRVNWIEVDGKPKFYGNMWGYEPPADSSRAAMEPPMVWIDMEFDNSPSELLWVDSEKWGPLDGSLLSFSYGYGKIQLVLHEEVNGQRQAGVIDLPGVKFLTGIMRGRFNPGDGQLYGCGMSAWGTSQMMQGGGLYRVRYTGKPVTVPVGLKVLETGVELTFAQPLNATIASQIENYEIKTWDILRSSEYGSDRYNTQTLNISKVELKPDGKTVKLYVGDIEPVDVMTISYDIIDDEGNSLSGTVQNTIHNLGTEPNS